MSLRAAHRRRVTVRTSVGVVAQVWRDGAHQAELARVLLGVDTVPLDLHTAKTIGPLMRMAGSGDVVDAHVASLAGDGDQVLTSDPQDIRRLLAERGVRAAVVGV